MSNTKTQTSTLMLSSVTSLRFRVDRIYGHKVELIVLHLIKPERSPERGEFSV